MGNTFGHLFRVTTWGESHGRAVGVVVDGCPPGLLLKEDDIQRELDRRRPGQSPVTTQRAEGDKVDIVSGIFENRTLGTPIAMLVYNRDRRSGDYKDFKNVYRPSHADYTYDAKYGHRDWRGGGRASARETIGRVAAGAIAKKLLRRNAKVQIIAYVKQIRDLVADVNPATVTPARVEKNMVRCPDQKTAGKMVEMIRAIRREGDSLGGVVEMIARNVPVGLGAPVFDKLEADLAKAMLSLPACKGFEIGSGFAGVLLTGSQHNDLFYMDKDRVRTRTNQSGGVQGGIANGEDILLRVAFKPTATIMKPQRTVDHKGRARTLKARGRHDPCVLPRAVPVVEAMASLVLADHWLRLSRDGGGM